LGGGGFGRAIPVGSLAGIGGGGREMGARGTSGMGLRRGEALAVEILWRQLVPSA